MNSRRSFVRTALCFGSIVVSRGAALGAPRPLPKVLIIGDSISGGYFPTVVERLRGKAEVLRAADTVTAEEKAGSEGTTKGVRTIDKWIGTTKWAVIHFNFGLHDIKHVNPTTGENSRNPSDPVQADLKQYQKNLTEIVGKLRTTGAKLIFATTTPYPATATKPMRSPGRSEKYNAVALEIMKANGVAIDDLYSLVLPRMAELQRPDNVHFTDAGYAVLGEAVAGKILAFL